MTYDPIAYAAEPFVAFANELIHQATAMFYLRKEEYPIDAELLKVNAFYATVLYDVYHDTPPTLSQANFIAYESKTVEDVLQEALSLYRKWGKLGKKEAIHDYGRRITDILIQNGLAKSKGGLVLLPNIESKAAILERELQASLSPDYRSRPLGRIGLF